MIQATIIAFWPVFSCGYVDYDDGDYIGNAAEILRGVTWGGIKWAFTQWHAANWHPLTFISLMLDVDLFGPVPRGSHAVNLLLHVLNTCLLFHFLKKVTGAVWRSALVAALFAFHPLHVESVAWIAERKDVLSAFFFFLTLIIYVNYVRAEKKKRVLWYILALFSFACGLLSKQMLVTLPFLLLLLDFWPLKRFGEESNGRISTLFERFPIRLVWEKLPFLALSIGASITVFVIQRKAGAMPNAEGLPWVFRIATAVEAYIMYLAKMLWPTKLCALYLYRSADYWPLWVPAGAICCLVILTWLCVKAWKRMPFVSVGWFWFLGMLIPVIGLVQVGMQSRADRYTYLPLIGVFIAIAWFLEIVARQWVRLQQWIVSSICLSLLALMVGTNFQARTWTNSETLFTRMTEVSDENHIAFANVGLTMIKNDLATEAEPFLRRAVWLKGDSAEAESSLALALTYKKDYKRAIQRLNLAMIFEPAYGRSYNVAGLCYEKQGILNAATNFYMKAIDLIPNYEEAHVNLGRVHRLMGNYEKAFKSIQRGLELEPRYAEGETEMGVLLAEMGKFKEAEDHFRRALRLKPQKEAMQNLAAAFLSEGKIDEAINHYQELLAQAPDYVNARHNYGVALMKKERYAEALLQFGKVLQLSPQDVGARFNRGKALAALEQLPEALGDFRAVINAAPDFADAHFAAAQVLARQHKREEASREAEEALRLQPDHGGAKELILSLQQTASGLSF